MIVAPRDRDEALVCVAYANTTSAQNKGKVFTRIRIEDLDGNEIRRMRIRQRVKNGQAFGCRNVEDIVAGYFIIFEHRFINLPRLRPAGGDGQSAAVTGVLSSAGRPALDGNTLALTPADGETPNVLLPGSSPGWFHSANSVFVAGGNRQDHPTAINRVLQLPRSSAANSQVCVSYASNANDGDVGTMSVIATLNRVNGDVEVFDFEESVEDNILLACTVVEKRMKQGALLVFEIVFQDMPAVRGDKYANIIVVVSSTGVPSLSPPGGGRGGGGGGGNGPGEWTGSHSAADQNGVALKAAKRNAGDKYANIIVAVSSTGEPQISPPGGRGGGSDGGGGGTGEWTGSHSVAGQDVIARVMRGAKYQIHRPSRNRPTRFMIVWPGTVVNLSLSWLAEPNTVCFGNTMEAAAADCAAKGIPLPAAAASLSSTAAPLSGSRLTEWNWFGNIDAGSGPTSIRRGTGSTVYSDAYRPWLGELIQGPFGSDVDAIRSLRPFIATP